MLLTISGNFWKRLKFEETVKIFVRSYLKKYFKIVAAYKPSVYESRVFCFGEKVAKSSSQLFYHLAEYLLRNKYIENQLNLEELLTNPLCVNHTPYIFT